MSFTVVQIVVEGETERDFVKKILGPYFRPQGMIFQFNVLHGVTRWGWEKVRNEIAGCIYDDPDSYCTTMLDLYGLPENTPGKHGGKYDDPLKWAGNIERSISRSLRELNERTGRFVAGGHFIPYVQVHEFEALLFSDPLAISPNVDGKEKDAELIKIRASYPTPEHINNHPSTAPSRRLRKLFGSAYQKPLCGTLIAEDIGLEKIRRECRHFNEWLTLLEGIAAVERQRREPAVSGQARR
jgi:hypothetical protein